jgi:protein-L-isoaspartate(D-aspartate) O-methyltransferase
MRSVAPLGYVLVLALSCARREADESRPATAATAAASSRVGVRSGAFDERRDERARLATHLAQRGVSDPAVLRAMREVPRHAFVAASWSEEAYDDRPLPIGHGQTISQPAVVASMTEAARPRREDKCLEVGTGSGYQAAVLAELCGRVFSIEYLAPLAKEAERTLRSLGYGPERIQLRTGDGYVGWPEAAPFQVVIVTAAPERVPQPLLDQLALGGRLVIPVGARDEAQKLELHRRISAGKSASSFETTTLMAVRFVPFLGDAARAPQPD